MKPPQVGLDNSAITSSTVKWRGLKAFLIQQALAGNDTAWKLLKDLPKAIERVNA